MINRGKSKITLLTALGLILFALSGCAGQSNPDQALTVKTAPVVEDQIETTLQVAGLLVPQKTVDISGKISAQALEVNYEAGDPVKAGAILVELDSKALRAQLEQAQAGLESARAAVAATQNQADLTRINLELLQKNYAASKALYEAGAISQYQMDSELSKLEQAQKQYDNAAGAALNQAQASVKNAQAAINNIQVQLENTVIKSPIDGVVINRNIDPGEIAGTTSPLFSIADTSYLKLKGTVAQEALPFLKTGQELKVVVDIYPDKIYQGTIASIGPMSVSTGEIFPLEITIKNNDGIKAGVSAHASIGITGKKGLIVPTSALVEKDGEEYVFVIKDQTALKRPVKIGLKGGQNTEILEGLSAGEVIASTNVNNLVDQVKVEVK